MTIKFIQKIDIAEIPESCRKCPLCEWGKNGVRCDLPIKANVVDIKPAYMTKRHRNCPLVVVED